MGIRLVDRRRRAWPRPCGGDRRGMALARASPPGHASGSTVLPSSFRGRASSCPVGSTTAEIQQIERVARVELLRAFSGLRLAFSDQPRSPYQVRVVQDLPPRPGPRPLAAAESVALGPLGSQGWVSFGAVSSLALSYAPRDADRATVLESIGRGIGAWPRTSSRTRSCRVRTCTPATTRRATSTRRRIGRRSSTAASAGVLPDRFWRAGSAWTANGRSLHWQGKRGNAVIDRPAHRTRLRRSRRSRRTGARLALRRSLASRAPPPEA